MSCQNIYESAYIDNATGSRGFWSDRDVNDRLILPQTYHDFKIKPNELVTAHVINRAFSKMYDNWLYLISKCRTPQSVVPNRLGYTEFIGTTGQSTDGLLSISSVDNEILPLSADVFVNSELTNQITGVFFSNDQLTDLNPSRGVVYVSSGDETNIVMLQNTSDGYRCEATSNMLDNFTNRSIPSDIVKTICVGDMLYTAGSANNVVYKHDISGLRRNDRSYFDPNQSTSGKLLVDIIGAPGAQSEDTRFKNIVTISSDDSYNMYVVDVDGSVKIKMFDKNSNHLTTYDITNHIGAEQVRDMCHKNNKFFVLTNTSVHEFTLKFVYIKKYQLNDLLNVDEHYMYITPSVENRNIVYVSTNRRIFKKFITRLSGAIGTFKFSGRDMHIDSDLMDIAFVSVVSGDDHDEVYVGDRSRGVIFMFRDSVDYQTVVTSTYENTIVTLQDIMIKSDEYVNYIVYNKALAKMFYNHAVLGNSIRKKIIAHFNDKRYLEFKALRYLLPQNIKSRNRAPTLKNFIGANEVVMSAVINRTFNYIYKLQQDLLYDISTDISDATQAPVSLTTPLVTPADQTWTYGPSGWSDSAE